LATVVTSVAVATPTPLPVTRFAVDRSEACSTASAPLSPATPTLSQQPGRHAEDR
jgi:hypothetical protein